MRGKSFRPSGDCEIPRLTMSCAGTVVMSRPWKTMRPRRGWLSPLIDRSVVDLPAPFAPIFVERIFEIIREINAQGTPILLVEQNALMALDVAKRGYVLETGTVALADDAKRLKENDQVKKTYLGAD